MDFRVKNVDVISRRNKPQEPCIMEWKNFDENVMNGMAMQAGCRPKYWNTLLLTIMYGGVGAFLEKTNTTTDGSFLHV